jgi:DNA polymerase III delta prime subunit
MQPTKKEFLWVERWRPSKIAECILPDSLTALFQDQVKKGQVQNMILNGSSGIGKTTVALALCEELGCPVLFIGASEESGIDVLRTDMRNFASTGSFVNKTKVIILDEAERLSGATQEALRSFIEEFSINCRFIFTCNHKNRLIPALHSRCKVVDFTIDREDRPKMAARFGKRLKDILTIEGVTYDEKVIPHLIMRYFPDYRRVLNELQSYAINGHIDEGILAAFVDTDVDVVVQAIKEKDFKKMRQWVADNVTNDPVVLMRKIFDAIVDQVKQGPELIVVLGQYQYQSAFCIDQEICVAAFCTEAMAKMKFKE